MVPGWGVQNADWRLKWRLFWWWGTFPQGERYPIIYPPKKHLWCLLLQRLGPEGHFHKYWWSQTSQPSNTPSLEPIFPPVAGCRSVSCAHNYTISTSSMFCTDALQVCKGHKSEKLCDLKYMYKYLTYSNSHASKIKIWNPIGWKWINSI